MSFNLFLADIKTASMTKKVMNVNKQPMSANKIVKMPDFWKANSLDSGEPRYLGGQIKESTVAKPMMAAEKDRTECQLLAVTRLQVRRV